MAPKTRANEICVTEDFLQQFYGELNGWTSCRKVVADKDEDGYWVLVVSILGRNVRMRGSEGASTPSMFLIHLGLDIRPQASGDPLLAKSGLKPDHLLPAQVGKKLNFLVLELLAD